MLLEVKMELITSELHEKLSNGRKTWPSQANVIEQIEMQDYMHYSYHNWQNVTLTLLLESSWTPRKTKQESMADKYSWFVFLISKNNLSHALKLQKIQHLKDSEMFSIIWKLN